MTASEGTEPTLERVGLLREPSPRCASRLNATLHYLTLKPTNDRETDVHRN